MGVNAILQQPAKKMPIPLDELQKLWESEVFWAWDFVQFQAGKVKCQGSGVKRDLLGPLSEGFSAGPFVRRSAPRESTA